MWDYAIKLGPGSVKVTDPFCQHMKACSTFSSNENLVDRGSISIRNALWLRLIICAAFREMAMALWPEKCLCGQCNTSFPALSLSWGTFHNHSCFSFFHLSHVAKIDGISPKIWNFPWVQGTAGGRHLKALMVMSEHAALNGDRSGVDKMMKPRFNIELL